MSMSISMAAMMLPSAAPFFFVYGRDSRRPAAVVLVVLVYGAVWVLLGAAVGYAMGWMMFPSSWLVAAGALVLAAGYTLAPWTRWARDRCREMCGRRPRGARLRDAIRDGLRYTACCVMCSAGVMVAIIVLGMSNLVVVTAGAAFMLAVKLTAWPAPVFSTNH